MAGDWIKMRCDLPADPAVYRLAAITRLDRFSVVGRLYAFWSWADRHAVDGRVDGASSHVVDDIVSCPGFADALVSVKWLVVGDDFVEIPYHERHNGESAKERGLKNARQSRWRDKKTSSSSTSVDGKASTAPSTRASTREEKSINTPIPPATAVAGGSGSEESAGDDALDPGDKPGRTGAVAIGTWLELCQEQGVQPIAVGSAPLRYAEEIGLPAELLSAHWAEFKARHAAPGAKRYRDWPRTLLNSLRDNWYRLWAVEPNGGVRVTSQGHQAMVAHAVAEGHGS